MDWTSHFYAVRCADSSAKHRNHPSAVLASFSAHDLATVLPIDRLLCSK